MILLKYCTRFVVRTSTRCFSSGSNSLVDVKTDNNGIAIVSMNRAPVNALNIQLAEDINRSFIDLEKNRSRGVILTSSCPTVFCAGLDINLIYNKSADSIKEYWQFIQNMWIKLYTFPHPVVAVINGHSPAGGCLITLGCDYRIIVPKVKIGLNEVQLGVLVPRWVQESMRNVIGDRKAEIASTVGRLFTSEEALNEGLVDEIASDKEAAIEAATKYLNVHSNIPSPARTSTKLSSRSDTIRRFIDDREQDTKHFVDFIIQPEVQETIGNYLAKLKKR